MKRITTLCMSIFFLFHAYGQYGYTYCATYNQTIRLGDTIALNIDNDSYYDLYLAMYSDPVRGVNTVGIYSLKPNNGTTYLHQVNFRGNAAGFATDYPNNVYIPEYPLPNESYYDALILTQQNSPAYNSFFGGDTGYVIYQHGGGFTATYDPQLFEYDTTYYWCMGWIKVAVDINYNSVSILSSCGCDLDSMVTGQSSPYVDGIQFFPSSVLKLINAPDETAFVLTANRHLAFDVYDAVGEKLMTGTIAQGTTPIDLSHYAPGIMVVVVTDETHTVSNTYKVIRW